MAQVEVGERVLVVTDYTYSSKRLANLVFETSIAQGAESAIINSPPPTGSFAAGSISPIAQAAADTSDAIFACTGAAFPLPVTRGLVKKGKRVMQMHFLNDDLVLRTVPIDLELLQRRANKLLTVLPHTQKVHMTSAEGSDLTFSLDGCKFALVYDGMCRQGEFDAVPAGAIGTLPVPYTGNGVIVIDGSVDGYGLVRSPIRLSIKDGQITKVEGDGPEAVWLDRAMKKQLVAGDKNANHWAEFVIGLNPSAQVCGSVLEDERHLGAVSIGWGRDTHLGGTFDSLSHGDASLVNPTITIDNVTIIEDGRPTRELS
jgi:leucyl aminopeptidase (aminopeptidase T)